MLYLLIKKYHLIFKALGLSALSDKNYRVSAIHCFPSEKVAQEGAFG
jgi:prenyltransferase beta subunit